MRNILVEITCPKCGYHKHVKSHTLVLPEMEPELRKRILRNTMFSFQCPCCRQEIMYLHNFLYHDKKHQFLIYMGEDGSCLPELREQFPQAILRHVQTPAQLIEKIRILEDGMDDRIIAFLKLQLKRKYPSAQIQYQDIDICSSSIWFTFKEGENKEAKGIDMDIYTSYQTRYASILKTSYIIDEKWATQCLDESKKERNLYE